MFDSSLSLTSTHTLILTFELSPLQNMPNVRDHDASVYLRLQGDALSVGGYEQNPIFWDEVTMTDSAVLQHSYRTRPVPSR